ncbi:MULTISPECIES: hypothetical protein [Parabacteroides]|jgi:hypothetical protein|uniref:Uncharacterized protein n=1 Tax=Parabacteroides gordonii MS-1 = DSM 23371 TaxID=1203610 RepID=A0A0F5IKQ9_9BACT|nr:MULTISPECIES: hypothetical protein [Parabacteroides]KKB45707.1 hypothetical protein HMPREF1536_05347 [Parabacteroides gordonii MS-1 = DSM 23371]KKB53026.1 hypothetical protein HMPREF1212_01188 [Parabacteroides sp. HGS0025]MCA5586325.1 hypothetical protein [Parabacteroides gordonii]RGP18596.1 hypothetical protein DXB27_04065 [Parabacteroides gordonii]
MKNFLFILTLLFGILLFSPQEEIESNDTVVSNKEAVMKEKGSADMQYFLTVLSTDLKGSNGLTARRTIQSTNNAFNLRTLKMAEKILQDIRLKEMNALRKISLDVSECQTINLSTLLCRMAQHVFVLRKLII